MPTNPNHLDSFDLQPGRVIGGKYAVESLLGAGWEGEVYRVIEKRSGAKRAAKLFFPKRNERDKALDFYASKLEHLSDCEIVIKYHHTEALRYRGTPVTALISEYVEGTLLHDLIRSRPGKRLPEYEALAILYKLVLGLEQIHARRDYHGDLHSGNVLIRRVGVHFKIKLVDLYNLGRPTAANRKEDVIDSIHLLHEMLGGQPRYAALRPELKRLICGLKRSIIIKRYPTARALRDHLDTFDWSIP